MKTLDFPGLQSDYKVYIGHGILGDIDWWRSLLESVQSKELLIVADEAVSERHLEPILNLLEENFKLDVHVHLIHAGERSKSLENARNLWELLDRNEFHRDSLLLAMGGGVTGDLCGFVASTYHRGMNLIQVPTTLLSMLDSSVGGKNAVNLDETKNVVGTFYDSSAVVIESRYLSTLPATLIASGLGEALKYSMLDTTDFISWLDRIPLIEDFQRETEKVDQLILDCLEIKRRHISQDVTDSGGNRALLNLGHTFAHALESISKYDNWNHGEAVAVGLVLATRLAHKLDRVDEVAVTNIESMAERLYLRTAPPKFPVEQWIHAFRHDKKAFDSGVEFILPHRDRLPERVPIEFDNPLLHELLSDFHSS